MIQKVGPQASTAQKIIMGIRRARRMCCLADDKIRIALEGLRIEDGIPVNPSAALTPVKPDRRAQ